MSRYFILLLILLSFTTNASNSERYYRLNPEALQKEIAACPVKQPKGISCDQLRSIAINTNNLAYQLRDDPQGYGKIILKLQETIAKQDSTKDHLIIKSDLDARLAVVKWLTSPG
jgi:hypothetical protein